MNTTDQTSFTLVISRNRQETAKDTDLAARLAAKFNVTVLSIPFLYDLASNDPVIQRLRALPSAFFLVPLAPRSVTSLLNHLQIPFVKVFETEATIEMPDGGIPGGSVEHIGETPDARWYPIIDDSKCAACLECVNYCLFGVYAIGKDSRPFVDQPDVCRDGCPACARVCPAKAIMFPLYEDRTIAGYEENTPANIDTLVDLVDQI